MDRVVDFNTGLTAQTHDPAGNTTSYTWDGLGRLTNIAPVSPEKPTVITYTSLKETHVSQTLSGSNFVETVYLYDDLGRQITTKRRNATGGYDIQQTEYDIAGRVTRKSEWAPDGTAAADLKWTTYDYTIYTDPDAQPGTVSKHPDPLGRIHGVTTPDDPTPLTPTTETTYDGDKTTVTVHDIRGWVAATDANITSTTVYTTDALGRLISVDSPGSGADAQYVYDESNNLTEVRLTDPAAPTPVQVRRFDYDRLGRLRLAANPENGTVEYTSYDARGNLLSYGDARQNIFKMAYDAADRLTTRKQAVGADLLLAQNTYDAANSHLILQESYKIDGVASSLVSRVQFGYQAADSSVPCPAGGNGYTGLNGRLSSQKTKIQPWVADLQTDYCQDELGMPTTLGYPDTASSGRTRTWLTPTYQNGYVKGLADTGRDFDYVTSVNYAAGGVPNVIVRGNNQRDIIDLDIRNRPTRFRTVGYLYPTPEQGQGGGQAGFPGQHHLIDLQDWSWCECTVWDTGTYAYDMAGNVKSIGAEQYHYDAMSRLVHGSIPNLGNTYSLDYGFDAFGNMTSQTRTTGINGGSAYTRSYGTDRPTNRLTQETVGAAPAVPYTYDENGNVIAAGTLGYVFDGQNRLREVRDPEKGRIGNYDYDASGYRVRAEANGFETFYFRDASGQVLSEFQRSIGNTANPVWNKDYIYAFGKSFALIKNEAPEAPKRPWATNVSASGLTLNWVPVADPDVLGYSLERRAKLSSSGSETVQTFNLDPENGTTWSDSYSTTYSAAYLKYTFTAMDTAGNLSPAGQELIVYPLASNPGPPTNVTATAGDRKITISWTAPTLTNNVVAGYYVFRQSVTNGPYSQLNDFPVSETTFVDIGLTNDQTYSYKVRTVDTSNRSSVDSAAVSKAPHDNTPPGRIIDVIAEADRAAASITVYWNRGGEPDIASYRVYRRTDSAVPTDADRISPIGWTAQSYTDTSATQGSTYYYSVAAVDGAVPVNVAAPSDPVSCRPRHSSVSVPVLQSAAFYIDNKGTTSTDGRTSGIRNNGNVSAEDDDVIEVKLQWAATSDQNAAGFKFHVYRKAPDETHYTLVGTPSPTAGTNIYPDTTVTKGDYTYYVTGWKQVGANWEESAAQAESGGPSDHAVSTYNANVSVRNLKVIDGRHVFRTYNRESRLATVTWSRVTEPALVGYNVYRNCSFHSGCGELSWDDAMEDLACESIWIRLNTTPLPPQQRTFQDSGPGGLQGCFRYAVRPVGPNGVEGPIDKIVEGQLDAGQAEQDPNASDTHSKAALDLPTFPLDASVSPTWSASAPVDTVLNAAASPPDPAGINLRARGVADPANAPQAPTAVTQYVLDKNEPPGHWWFTKFARVSWTMAAPPSDLLGFHIETAGSPNGPWQRLTKHPVAWWERDYIVQGVGIARAGSYSGHTECLRYRVIAVDESGNESAPVLAATTSPATCPATLDPPKNLRASLEQSPPSCKTRLQWDAPPGATSSTEYYVYRTVIKSGYPLFYDTQHVLAGATNYIESGDPGQQYDWTNPNDYCPFSHQIMSSTACAEGSLEAFYVTARMPSGGESPRSNLVFWTCGGEEDYAAMRADDAPTEAIASAPHRLSGEQLACWIDGDSMPEEAFASEPPPWDAASPAMLATAPMIRLGINDPPWSFVLLHTDHLGTVRVVTDPAGALVSTHDYFPFGEEITPQFSYNTHQYTGHERDQESGLDYMLARYYGDSLPRFLSPDPVEGTASSPQSWNRYPYANNNPTRFTDPTGMYGIDPDGPLGPQRNPCDTMGPMCHDFTSNDPAKSKAAYDNQERARNSLGHRIKRFFSHLLGMNLEDELLPGHGVTINLDEKPPTFGALGETSVSGDKIWLDMSRLKDPEMFRATLLHETAHRAAALKFGNRIDDSTVWPALRAQIDRQLQDPSDWALLHHLRDDGYVGLAAEVLQYGYVYTWRH